MIINMHIMKDINHHILYVCKDIKRSSKIKSWFIGSARACFVCAHILFTAIGSYTCGESLGPAVALFSVWTDN